MYTKSRITQEKLLKSPLKLIGAKTRSRDLLYHMFPTHKAYIEPFLGSGSVLIGKPKAEIEYVGDINKYVIDFFNRFDGYFFQELQYFVEGIETAEDPKAWWISLRDHEMPEHLIGVWFYMITKYCMNGIFRKNKKGECNSSFCGTVKGRGILTREWFEAVEERIFPTDEDLIPTKFLHANYEQLLIYLYQNTDLLGKRSTFIFCDPPYRYRDKSGEGCVTTYNGIKFVDRDQQTLFTYLTKVCSGSKWMLTINKDSFIMDLYKDFYMYDHIVSYSCSQTIDGRGPKTELIITNYDLQDSIDSLPPHLTHLIKKTERDKDP